jgi:fructan beta-fructosidase
MVHWTQQDHALLPYRVDGRAGTIFSGTAVVDHNDSLGVQRGDTKTLCAFFTFANRPKFYQAMAYSTDSGRNWAYWNDGRPVVDNQGFDNEERDPKVFWHAASKQWVMALWVQRNPGRVRFFTSQNLVDWKFASDLMRDWAFECMDMFFLPVDGNEKNVKAVLCDASFDYEVGSFDGKVFHTESGPFRAGGGNFYAPQTFNDCPNGRTVQIGWMRGGPNTAKAYGLPYNQQMSFPCDLGLRTTSDGIRVFASPVSEIASLVTHTDSRNNVTLRENENLLNDIKPLDLVDLEIHFDPGSATRLVFDFPRVTLTYDTVKKSLQQTGVRDDGKPEIVTVFENLPLTDHSIKLRFLVDRLSVEAYACDGEQFQARYFSPQNGRDGQSIHTIGGEAKIKSLEVRELGSVWERR